MGIYIVPILYIERLLRGVVIVLAYDNESFLLAALIVLSLSKLVVFLHHPYAVTVTNYFHIVLEGLWIIVYITLAIGLLNEDNFTVTNKLAVGWASCIIIMVMILLAIIYASAQLLIF